jgi:hypothetical protein
MADDRFFILHAVTITSFVYVALSNSERGGTPP